MKKQEQASTINQQLKVDAIQLYEGIRERERDEIRRMMVLGTHVDTKKNSTNGEEMFNDIKEAVFGKACGRVIELETRTQWLDKLREVIKKQVPSPKEEAWKLDTSCTVKGLCMEEKLECNWTELSRQFLVETCSCLI